MKQWHDLMTKVMEHGEIRNDRTGVGTVALFGEFIELDNSDTFPAVTSKKLYWKPMAGELAGFLQGARDNAVYKEMGCNIWDGNANADYWLPRAKFPGDIGRIYGVQWKNWITLNADGSIKHTDQIKELVAGIKKEPHSRRHLVTALNPGEMDQMCLPPCHIFFQVFVRGTDTIDIMVYMRSVDLFVGLPFDIASYALFQRLLAKEVGMKSGKLKFMLGDAHVYRNHFEQVAEVTSRSCFEPPKFEMDKEATLFNFRPEMARLVDYNSHDGIKAAMNV